ncbi:SDR family NAD(P)-dependent oxidoreductase [Dactylosporangium sp. NPDC049140]|jgi:short-subunit dehydrogenase|uniref:SDR family NAD(P)-dependent oxidoreductase n=1 Tax=Dactylosporangium sp. NPDC049140 TaxID=3155647 RepID=UPI0033FE1C62
MPRALIVGNTDGIGLALTRRLLDEGWSAVGVSRRASGLDHPAYEHLVADVAAAGYPAALDGLAAFDLCVYAAGIGEPLDVDALGEQTAAIRVNLLGAALTAEAVLPAMLAAGRGHLIGLSSLADVVISPDAPGYAASKAGLTSYLLGLGQAVRRRGVAVTAVRFGFVDTKMAKSPVTPFKIGVDEAVTVLMRAVRRRPAVVSYPRRMSVAARALRGVSRLSLR